MLIQLTINGLALIDRLNMEFDNRFNVLTGETGAGKSIIIDAVSLLLGARAQSEIIRSKNDKARVEGMFIIPNNHPLEGLLDSYGFEVDSEDRALILTREITLNGKNTCRINNRLVTLSVFKEIGKQMINIYGQHDFQSLSQSENHIFLLDGLGEGNFQNLLTNVEESFNKWKMVQKQLASLTNSAEEKAQKIDFLKFQIDEINSLSLTVNEDEEINAELKILENWEKIFSVLTEGYELLYGHNSAYDKASKANQRLSEILTLDKDFEDISNNLQTAVYYIEDVARALKGFEENFNFDSERKEFLEDRKYAIDRLKKKYGGSIISIIDFKNKAEKELDELVQNDFLIEELEKKAENYKNNFYLEANKLSKARQKVAKTLEGEMKKQLLELSMPNTEFRARLELSSPGPRGIDKVEFLISPNPGEPLKPLARIASGGEMSRIMLAFKVILARTENLTTLIFDEIDTGIGGDVVKKVAEKLFQVSQYYQVLCVTHSPHIASLAHRHFKIYKSIEKNATFTKVQALKEEERILEMARMLGGNEEITMIHATEMFTKAKNKNQTIY